MSNETIRVDVDEEAVIKMLVVIAEFREVTTAMLEAVDAMQGCPEAPGSAFFSKQLLGRARHALSLVPKD